MIDTPSFPLQEPSSNWGKGLLPQLFSTHTFRWLSKIVGFIQVLVRLLSLSSLSQMLSPTALLAPPVVLFYTLSFLLRLPEGTQSVISWARNRRSLHKFTIPISICFFFFIELDCFFLPSLKGMQCNVKYHKGVYKATYRQAVFALQVSPELPWGQHEHKESLWA